MKKHERIGRFGIPLTLLGAMLLVLFAGDRLQAQQPTPVDSARMDCSAAQSIYESGALIFACEPVVISGTPFIQETDRLGVVTTRIPTSEEISRYEFKQSLRQCRIAKLSARLTLATPVSTPTLSDAFRRLNAVEKIIAEDC